MRKGIGAVILAVITTVALMGCDAGVFMGGKGVGVRSGEFVYSAGYVVSTYKDSLERVQQAAEAVMKDMKATGVGKEVKIAQVIIHGMIAEEKVTVKIDYREWQSTTVSILVGMGGSKIAARLIHDKIAEKLAAL